MVSKTKKGKVILSRTLSAKGKLDRFLAPNLIYQFVTCKFSCHMVCTLVWNKGSYE